MLRQDPHQQKEVLTAEAKRQGKTWPFQRHLFPRATSNFIKKLKGTDKTLPAPPSEIPTSFFITTVTYTKISNKYMNVSPFVQWHEKCKEIKSGLLLSRRKWRIRELTFTGHSNNSQEIYMYFFIGSLQEPSKLGNIVPNSRERKLSLRMFMGLRIQNFKSRQALNLGL